MKKRKKKKKRKKEKKKLCTSCTTFPNKKFSVQKKVIPTIYTHNRCNNATCYLYTSRTNSRYIKISREILAKSSPNPLALSSPNPKK